VEVPIERHAYAVYTRVMYEKFYDELYASGSYVIQERDESTKFIVVNRMTWG
jgi:hypothetical protein